MIWLMFGSALAAGIDADLELLRISVGHDAMVGIRSPTLTDFGGASVVLLSQYQQDPLVLFEEGYDQGAVVSRRFTNELGIGFDFSKRLGLRVTLPTVYQWGTELPSLSRSGLGIADTMLGARILVVERTKSTWGATADAYLPSSTDNAWLGEAQPRLAIGVNSLIQHNDLDFFINSGLLLRQPVNTNLDFILGNELQLRFGTRWNIWPDHFSIGTTVLSNMGMLNFLNGGAENASEILNSVQWYPQSNIQASLGAGKGLSTGYGTSEIRLFANLMVTRKPKPPPPPEDFILEIEEPVVPVIVEEPPQWEPEELAKVEADQILIRDSIRFELGTATILSESKPTVSAIALLINEDVQLGHVVIEGHASEEGSDGFNYDLSNLRARSIYKELVEAGVHPDRLSHRGYGEALPKVIITKENSGELLAENRRVEFHIVRQDPPDTKIKLRDILKKPWNGALLESTIPEPKPKVKDDGIDNSFEFNSPSEEPNANETLPNQNEDENKPDSESEGESP